MDIKLGSGNTEYGPGIRIDLTGEEVAAAISTYLFAHGVHVDGPRTIKVNGALCESGYVYVDPSGFVISGAEKYSGSGKDDAVKIPTFDRCIWNGVEFPYHERYSRGTIGDWFCRQCGYEHREKATKATGKDILRLKNLVEENNGD